jgi:hypothetical protein
VETLYSLLINKKVIESVILKTRSAWWACEYDVKVQFP